MIPGGGTTQSNEYLQLHSLIANDIIDAVGEVHNLGYMLSGADHVDALGRLIRATEGYDFDEALELLRVLAGELDIKL